MRVVLVLLPVFARGAMPNEPPGGLPPDDDDDSPAVTSPPERPAPLCVGGCLNGGVCVHASATNSTGVCDCAVGWTGRMCESCYGRTRLNATEDIKLIHDGHGNYTSNALSKCSWLIEGDGPIKLKIASLETECGWDHLYIFDGTSALDSATIGAYCGIVKQEHTLYATSGSAFLHFYSDMAYNMSGFEIEYSLVEKAEPEEVSFQDTDKQGNTWRRSPHGMGGRAGVSMAVLAGSIYAWGGYQFPGVAPDNRVWRFDGRDWVNVTSGEEDGTPPLRYGGAMVALDKDLLVYGGVRYEPDYEVLGDMWLFNVESNTWRTVQLDKQTAPSLSEGWLPLTNSGHSLVKVLLRNQTQRILAYGGYSPSWGYLTAMQEITIDESDQVEVSLPFTMGDRPTGSYGHVALVDPIEPWLVYYYGGFKNSALSDALTVYNAETRRFSRMVNSKMNSVNARWFHSGVVLGRNLVFLSGNTHTDTAYSTGSLCFSNDVIVYSLECNKWKLATIPEWMPRYGASAVVYDESLFALGGFNGRLLDDWVKVSFPSEFFASSESVCDVEPAEMEKCSDRRTSPAQTYLSSLLGLDYGCVNCKAGNYWTPESSYRECSYCSGGCSSQCPRATIAEDQCAVSQERNFACEHPGPKCSACVLSGCEYFIFNNISEKRTYSTCAAQLDLASDKMTNLTMSRMNTTSACHANKIAFECGTYRSCESCTQKQNCMWCGILDTCVSNEAHVTSFPFGQCHEWFQKQHCFKTTCQGHRTCRSCQNDPRCGWCDDGTGRGSGTCLEGSLKGANKTIESEEPECPVENWFWVGCPQCNCSGHSKCDKEGNCLACSNFTTGDNCERCMDDYHGIALNNGTCQKCECGVHGKSCDHTTGKCSCTTKGIVGPACDQCDKDGYKGDALNNTCYYDIKTDFQYSFRMKPDIDKDVTKLNCIVVPTKAEPGIKVKVIIEQENHDTKSRIRRELDENITLSVTVKTMMPSNGTYEELLTSATNTTNFEHSISVKKYTFGPETNRTILIYIYDFKTPLKIKVTVTQHVPMSLLTFFLVFFACFLSLLLIAVIVWKLKTMWDVQLQRRAVMNEMRQMAARPFASVEMQLTESEEDKTLVTPACYEVVEDRSAAVATVLLLLPRHRSGAPSIGDSAVCFGSVMINYNEKYEADFLLDGDEDEWESSPPCHTPDSET